MVRILRGRACRLWLIKKQCLQFFGLYNILLILHLNKEDEQMAKEKKVLTEEEKAAKKQHIKEEIQAYLCMFLFLALFAVMFAMFGSQSSLFSR